MSLYSTVNYIQNDKNLFLGQLNHQQIFHFK